MKLFELIRKWTTIIVLAIVSAGMITGTGEDNEFEKSKWKKEQR